MTRYARRTDASQREVIQALEACGLSVRDLSRLGHGAPDLLVSWGGQDGFSGKTACVEVKVAGTSYGKRLADSQLAWLQGWQGEYVTLRTAEDAITWALNFKRGRQKGCDAA